MVFLYARQKEIVERKAVSKQIQQAKYGTKWTQDEIDFVLKHIGPMSDQDVADHLGKTVNSVQKWVQRYDNKRLCR